MILLWSCTDSNQDGRRGMPFTKSNGHASPVLPWKERISASLVIHLGRLILFLCVHNSWTQVRSIWYRIRGVVIEATSCLFIKRMMQIRLLVLLTWATRFFCICATYYSCNYLFWTLAHLEGCMTRVLILGEIVMYYLILGNKLGIIFLHTYQTELEFWEENVTPAICLLRLSS